MSEFSNPAATGVADAAAYTASQLKLLNGRDPLEVGVHSERGEESLGHMMKLYAAHDLVHLRQIERIRGGTLSS